MKNIILKAVLLIEFFLTHDPEPTLGVLNELVKLSNELKFPMDEYGEYSVTINVHNQLDTDLFPEDIILSLTKIRVLELAVTVPIPEWEYKLDPPHDIIDPEIIHQSCLEDIFTKRVHDFLMSVNLAKVGTIGTRSSWLFVNGKRRSTLERIETYDYLKTAVSISLKIGWPNIQQLDILETWKWISGFEGFLDGFGKGQVERALNAFSYLLEFNFPSPLALVWALIGIETLYVKGQRGILEQVREKTQIFLGEQSQYKKKLSQMYQFRSRFVHGDIAFPGAKFSMLAMKDYENYSSDLDESTELAVAILIATLQKLCIEERKQLSFIYTLEC